MKTSAAISFFKTQQGVADVLERCSQGAVSQWGKYPPLLRQLELERASGGKLKAESAADKFRFGARVAA